MEKQLTQSEPVTADQLFGEPVDDEQGPALRRASVCSMTKSPCSAWDGLNGECLAPVCFYVPVTCGWDSM
ncbi:MAG: hypothetical protein DRP56_01020 [Planctomycetota bacterium]|nr:MAG: hypothetical protein DRP56_01020 [Planctomycetota bacterium]